MNRSNVVTRAEKDQTTPLTLTRTSVTNSSLLFVNETLVINNQSLVIPPPLLLTKKSTEASIREPLPVIDKNNTLNVQQLLVPPVKSINVANRTKEETPKKVAA